MASDAKQATPSVASLMSLPLEIREMILELAFDLPSSIEHNSKSKSAPATLTSVQHNMLITYPSAIVCKMGALCTGDCSRKQPQLTISLDYFKDRTRSLSKLCVSCRADYHRFAIVRVNEQLRQESMRVLHARTFQIRLCDAGIRFNGVKESEAWDRLTELQIWRAREIHVIVDDLPKHIAVAQIKRLMGILTEETPRHRFFHLEFVTHGNFLWRIHAPDEDTFDQIVAKRQLFKAYPYAADTHDRINAAVDVGCIDRIAALFRQCGRFQQFRLTSRIRDPVLFTHLCNRYPAQLSVQLPISPDPRLRVRQLPEDIASRVKMHHSLYIVDRVQRDPAESLFRFHGELEFHRAVASL